MGRAYVNDDHRGYIPKSLRRLRRAVEVVLFWEGEGWGGKNPRVL